MVDRVPPAAGITPGLTQMPDEPVSSSAVTGAPPPSESCTVAEALVTASGMVCGVAAVGVVVVTGMLMVTDASPASAGVLLPHEHEPSLALCTERPWSPQSIAAATGSQYAPLPAPPSLPGPRRAMRIPSSSAVRIWVRRLAPFGPASTMVVPLEGAITMSPTSPMAPVVSLFTAWKSRCRVACVLPSVSARSLFPSNT